MKSLQGPMKSDSEARTDSRYLIIGGAPKSGTTSLFRYLSDHPEVCPANRKETYFFAREFDRKNVCSVGESSADFETYFSHCNTNAKFRLEATPYTLYAKDAPKKIAATLPNSSMLFMLRDPINRLISDYCMYIQRNHASTHSKLKDFFEWQLNMPGDIPNLLKFGCYLEYLQPFIETFGPARVLILFFEDFFANPVAQVEKLCEHLGIDEAFYQSYGFETHNPTINFRSSWFNKIYMSLEPVVADLRAGLIHIPMLHKFFEEIILIGKSTYRRLNNQGKKQQEDFPPEVIARLKDYYQSHNKALSEELGVFLPWDSFHNELFRHQEA
jgi:hypothetical protein